MALSYCIELNAGERRQLLGIARQSIGHGLTGSGPLPVAEEGLAAALKARLGVFVTLTRNDSLRGCIGSLHSTEPLARSVANSAYSAAFEDPRFIRLGPHEVEETAVDISVLSPLEPIHARSRRELLDMLRPGRDGLLLEDLRHRSTFLPKVWEQLPDPGEFLDQLLAKAGLPEHHWSATLRFKRYRAVSFSEATL